MATGAPDILVRRGIDRGLIGTTLMSALLHAAVVGLLIALPAQFLRAPDRMDSYTVDLVAPNVLGGTQLVPGGGNAAEPVNQPEPAPVGDAKPAVPEPAAKEPVEPYVEPKPPEPPAAAPKPAPEPPQAAAAPVQAPEPPKPVEAKPIEPPPKAAEAPPPVAAKPPEAKPAPAPKPPPVEAKPPEPKPPEPVAKPAAKPPEPKPPEAVAKSAAKPPEPKPISKPAEPPQPVARAEPPKSLPPAPKVAVANPPAAEAVKKPEAAPTETAGQREAKKRDAAIAAAIQRRSGAVQAGAGTEASNRDKQIAAAVQRRAQQVGSGAGSAAPGPGGPISVGPGSGAGGTPTDLQYILYQGKMDERIKAAWAWAGADKSLRAVIQFNLTPAGEIRNVRTIESSGDRQYDVSCERAVRVSSPLDPVPEKYRELFATVEMTFKPTDVEH